LVPAEEPVTTVRIHQVNTGSMIVARVRVKDGKPLVDGGEHIDGVPVDGSPIELDFSDAAGAITGKLLPTGNAVDKIMAGDGKSYDISIVDAAMAVAFIRASDIGLSGTETPAEIERDSALMEKIEELRGRCAVKIGLVEDWRDARSKSSYTPFFACVSEPQDYGTFDGKAVKASEVDIVSRLLFMQRMHKTHPVTGTVCMGAAARINGSVVEALLGERGAKERRITIGHPGGAIPVISEMETTPGGFSLKNAAILRTARIIMKGQVYLRFSRV
jgi:2-methylaconitate cis-trans-isomerase PrpF